MPLHGSIQYNYSKASSSYSKASSSCYNTVCGMQAKSICIYALMMESN